MRASTTFLGAAAALFLVAGAARAADPVAMELDGLRVVRDRSLPTFGLTVTVHNIGPEERELSVREVRLLDGEKVLQRLTLEARVPGLGRDWARLQPLLALPHDEVSLYLDDREAAALFEKAERTQVEVLVPFVTRAFVPRFVPGATLVGTVEVDYEYGGSLGTLTDHIDVDLEELLPPLVPPVGAPVARLFLGDTHVHSAYTDCDAPFRGRYPIAPFTYNPKDEGDDLTALYKAAGLQWFNLSDHCYCVNQDEFADQSGIAANVSSSSFLIIPGLEMSAREKIEVSFQCVTNGHDTAHFNGIGLLPSDSLFAFEKRGERFACDADAPVRKADAPFIQEAASLLRLSSNSLRGAVSLNHPGGTALSGLAEPWNLNEAAFACVDAPPETGMEIINSRWDNPQDGESVDHWARRRLLKGLRVAAYGGSDVHKKKEDIGVTFTGVFADSLDRGVARSVEDGLRRGRTFASTGPLLAEWARPAGAPTWTEMGDTRLLTAGTDVEVHVAFASGARLVDVCLIQGRVGDAEEQQVPGSCQVQVSGSGHYVVTLPALPAGLYYVRAEAIGWKERRGELVPDDSLRAFATPVWLSVH